MQGFNKEPFNDRTTFDHLSTKLIHNSDPHCIFLSECRVQKQVSLVKDSTVKVKATDTHELSAKTDKIARLSNESSSTDSDDGSIKIVADDYESHSDASLKRRKATLSDVSDSTEPDTSSDESFPSQIKRRKTFGNSVAEVLADLSSSDTEESSSDSEDNARLPNIKSSSKDSTLKKDRLPSVEDSVSNKASDETSPKAGTSSGLPVFKSSQNSVADVELSSGSYDTTGSDGSTGSDESDSDNDVLIDSTSSNPVQTKSTTSK